MKKNIIIIILILIILGLVGYITYDKIFTTSENNDVKTNEKNNKEEKILVKKVDDSKDYIYDGEYIGEFSSDSYVTDIGDTYYSKNLKAPYFNIDSTDASNSNKEINETYLNAVRIFNQGVSDNSTYIKLDYKKYMGDDVFSAILKYEVGDIGATNPIYYTYNFDKTTGKLITYKDAYTIAGFNDDNIDEKVKEAIIKEIKKQMGNSEDAYPEGTTIDTYVDKTYFTYIEGKKYDFIKYILDSKNKLTVVIDIQIPAELDHLNIPLEIK